MTDFQTPDNLKEHDFRRSLYTQKRAATGSPTPLFERVKIINQQIDKKTDDIDRLLARKSSYTTMETAYQSLVESLSEKLMLEIAILERYERDENRKKQLKTRLAEEYKKVLVLVADSIDKTIARY
ncbi:MAG: hypothetical protein WC310_00875 [Patescibacteria group bacterium]|jgi:hypothetical protein